MLHKTALSLMMGFALSASAQEASSSAPVAAKTDFSTGFQKLVKLGLPSLEGAQWSSAEDESHDMDDYELREIFSGLKGHGWKLQAHDKPTFLPLGAVDSKEITASEGRRSGGGLLSSLLGRGSKQAKSADLIADANQLIATLENPEKSKELRQGLEYRGASSLGRLLIFATQLHQSGHPTEANHLAQTVFSLGANPEAVIDAAISRLAARDLAVVTEVFFTRKDWAAYERDLRTLSERYSRGWDTLPAVQMLLPAVTKRAAGTLPTKPAIEGATLNPEAVAALDATLQDAKGAPDDEAVTRYAKQHGVPVDRLTPALREQLAEMLSHGGDEDRSGGPWLIDEPPAPGSESKDAWSRLKRLGLEALPALAAVAHDDTLTFSRNASSDRSHYFSSRESAMDRALSAYQAMDRPQTRGELACRLLASALPGESSGENDPQSLADSAMEFWKNHHGKSRLDLLLVFLAEGDSSQKRTASTMLAQMPDDAAHRAFEKYVLESDDLTSTIESVAPYLKLRKAAAKEFFTRFSAALKAQLDGADLERSSGGYEIKRAGGVDKYLKKLSLFISGESPRKLVLELAKAEKPDLRQIQSLADTVAETSPDQLVPLYLEAAVIAKHLETRAAFLNALPNRSYRYRNQPENEEEEKETPIPAAQIAHWTTLLEDDRHAADGEPIRLRVARLIGYSHSPATTERIYIINQLDPVAGSELILARAKERVAGKPPTPLPDADKVSATRVDEMLKQLAAAKPEAVHALVKSWPLEDRLAFLKWQGDPEHAEKFPASVIAARKLLIAPTELPRGPSVAQQTEILQSLDLKPGAKIDYELIKQLANSLASAAKKQSGLVVNFDNSQLDTGVNAQAFRLSNSSDKSSDYVRGGLRRFASTLKDAENEAAVEIDLYFEPDRILALWIVHGKTITPPEPEILEKLRESLSRMDQSNAQTFRLSLSVLHRDDLEKLTKTAHPDVWGDGEILPSIEEE